MRKKYIIVLCILMLFFLPAQSAKAEKKEITVNLGAVNNGATDTDYDVSVKVNGKPISYKRNASKLVFEMDPQNDTTVIMINPRSAETKVTPYYTKPETNTYKAQKNENYTTRWDNIPFSTTAKYGADHRYLEITIESGQADKLKETTANITSQNNLTNYTFKFQLEKQDGNVEKIAEEKLNDKTLESYGISSENAEKQIMKFRESRSTVGKHKSSEKTTNWIKIKAKIKKLQEPFRLITNVAFAFSIMTSVFLLGITIFQYATSGTHPMQRRKSIENLMSCLVCIALLGSIKLLTLLLISII